MQKKKHPSLQESLNAAKHFFGGLNLLRFNKDFLSKKKLLSQIYVSRVNHNMKLL